MLQSPRTDGVELATSGRLPTPGQLPGSKSHPHYTHAYVEEEAVEEGPVLLSRETNSGPDVEMRPLAMSVMRSGTGVSTD